MAVPITYSFSRYLAAKKSVDDRALNGHVWESLGQALALVTPATPLRVLEVGAGIGTMVERLLERGLLTYAAYTALDVEAGNIYEARRRLPAWATSRGFSVEESQEQLCIQRRGQSVRLELETLDLFDFAARERSQRAWDLVIAHAFLDLVDVSASLPALLSLLRPGGLLYGTLVFDGATIFQPELDPALDARIEHLYHQTMDRRITAGKPSGDSRAGRHLFGHLGAAGVQLLDAGGSDWVVFAGSDGYPADEAYFLHYIVHTVHTALQGQPDLDAACLTDWIARRHAQVEEGSLVYIAHQLDFLGRRPAN
jgi:SAM-dependent methyltransferase